CVRQGPRITLFGMDRPYFDYW
nr:immunoglobulin heavy chain junction region [Macaca mulatta]MOV47467.1 immunoglobulin heavy chain junction region [Macaca mulatta]MOV47490.1 immunoglobulin heavy chain junction region [Macaca mulatta]MOV47578.1 immunoglobulin heavy chain junction region [Macaca mulatta]MOV47674.1 immunoglobulin heavy chain junction region [Macaca mulatta]